VADLGEKAREIDRVVSAHDETDVVNVVWSVREVVDEQCTRFPGRRPVSTGGTTTIVSVGAATGTVPRETVPTVPGLPSRIAKQYGSTTLASLGRRHPGER